MAWLVNPLRILGLCHTLGVTAHIYSALSLSFLSPSIWGGRGRELQGICLLALLPPLPWFCFLLEARHLLRPRFFCRICLSLSRWTEGDIIGAARWPEGDGASLCLSQLLLLLGREAWVKPASLWLRPPQATRHSGHTHIQLHSRPAAASCHQESPQLRSPPVLSYEKPLLWGCRLEKLG